MPMSNEVITHNHEWVRGLFSELDRIAKDAATRADLNNPFFSSISAVMGMGSKWSIYAHPQQMP